MKILRHNVFNQFFIFYLLGIISLLATNSVQFLIILLVFYQFRKALILFFKQNISTTEHNILQCCSSFISKQNQTLEKSN